MILTEPSVDFDSLRRFVRNAPNVRRLLSSPASCDEELMLRESMRRTVAALAIILDDAAQDEAAPVRAAVLRETSLIASELAACRLRRDSVDH